MIFIPLLVLAAGTALVLGVVLSRDNPPVHEPDIAPNQAPPGSTHYKLVDAILPELKKASQSSNIPLGLLVGWIAKESGGKLSDTTSLDERGYFQLMPDESKSLGLDHDRLSTDETYSINAGLLLIGKYAKTATAYGIFPVGTLGFWMLVKLIHTVGNGDVQKYVSGAKAAGATSSWAAFEAYCRSGDAKTKHSPTKWFDFLDALLQVGLPFGFGTDAPASVSVVGGDDDGRPAGYSDIPDPLLLLPRYRNQS